MKDRLMTIRELFLNPPIDEMTRIRGWVRSVRKKKHFSFMVLNDGSCQQNIQIVIDKDLANYDEVSKRGQLTMAKCYPDCKADINEHIKNINITQKEWERITGGEKDFKSS